MDEVLTMAEIEDRFDGEWVLIDEPETNEYQEVLSGRLRFHSSDRDEVDRAMLALRSRRFAVLYIGEMAIPEGTEFIL
jgi:hypothetical protein